jgi:hypothetical protein
VTGDSIEVLLPPSTMPPIEFLRVALAATLAVPVLALPGRSQVETFLYDGRPASKVGPATKVKPADCRTNPADGSITCDTKLENSPSDTPAKPKYQPFNN